MNFKNVRRHRYIELVKTNERRHKLVSRANHKTKYFSENLLAIGLRKTKVKMHNPVYLGLSVLDISKLTVYKYWYNWIKLTYKDNAKLCSMDRDSFIVHVKTESIAQELIPQTMMFGDRYQ